MAMDENWELNQLLHHKQRFRGMLLQSLLQQPAPHPLPFKGIIWHIFLVTFQFD